MAPHKNIKTSKLKPYLNLKDNSIASTKLSQKFASTLH